MATIACLEFLAHLLSVHSSKFKAFTRSCLFWILLATY
jgi:hypothetical protein